MPLLRLFGLFLFAAMHCAACVCSGLRSPSEAWTETPVIFIGHIDRLETTVHPKKWSFQDGTRQSFTAQRAWLRVDEPLRGTTAGTVFAIADDGDCTGKFKGDEGKLLVYGFPTRTADTLSLACTRSSPLSSAADDLLFLRALPASAQKTRII